MALSWICRSSTASTTTCAPRCRRAASRRVRGYYPPPMRSGIPLAAFLLSAPAAAQTIRVDVTPGHATNTIRPALALGAGIDRIGPEMAKVIYEPDTVKEVLSAGYGTVSYRLNTELHVQDWHWNPKGTWSGKDRGYFVGDANPG